MHAVYIIQVSFWLQQSDSRAIQNAHSRSVRGDSEAGSIYQGVWLFETLYICTRLSLPLCVRDVLICVSCTMECAWFMCTVCICKHQRLVLPRGRYVRLHQEYVPCAFLSLPVHV